MSLLKIKLISGLILVSLLLTGQVLSHGNLQSAKPEPGQTVTESPETIELTFNESIKSGSINLVRTGGSPIPLTLMGTDQPDMLIAHIDKTLDNGEYSVLWVATSADDHTINGSYNFAVDTSGEDHVLYLIGGVAFLILLAAGWIVMRRKMPSGELDHSEA